MNRKFVVDTGRAPRAVGPYSQAVGYNGLLYVSGLTAIDTHTGKVSRAGIETQTRTVLEHLTGVLHGAGLDFSHVLKVTVYLRNLNDFELMDSVYALYCDHAAPARTVVEVTRLLDDALVMMDCVAAAPADYEDLLDDHDPGETPHFDPDVAEPLHHPDVRPDIEVTFGDEPVMVPPPVVVVDAAESSPVDPKAATMAGWDLKSKLPPPKLPVPGAAKDDSEA